MPTGKIKWFSPVKGYGFITKEDGSDVFLHASFLAADEDRHLFPGDLVEFQEIGGEKGPKATDVRRVPEGDAPDASASDGQGDAE